MMPYLLLLFALLLSNCGSPQTDRAAETPKLVENPDSTLQETKPISVDSLTYSYQVVRVESNYLSGSNDLIDTTYSQIRYPVFSSDAINVLVKRGILFDEDDNVEQAAQAFIDAFDEFVEDAATQHVHPWIYDVESSVQLQTKRLLTISTRAYEYSGGAHGHSVVIWSNYDLQHMREITLSDLFEDANLTKLEAIAEKKFREAEGLSSDSPLSKDYFFSDGKFALNNNFGLTAKNLIFYYNEYEIKPYSEGSTTIEIAYDKLMDILSPTGRAYISHIQTETK